MSPIKITKTLELSLSADEWSLYNIEGRDAAALAINSGVAEALNAGNPRAAHAVLRSFEDFGAADTEGNVMLLYIVGKMK